jgi:hypothetical protein
MSFALNYYLGEYDVRGYHLFNILIHLISAVLVYWLAIDLFGRQCRRQGLPPSSNEERPVVAAALLAAAIFLVHPIQAQSVTYIVQRMSSMAAMFYILALLLYNYGRERRRAQRWAFWLGGDRLLAVRSGLQTNRRHVSADRSSLRMVFLPRSLYSLDPTNVLIESNASRRI